MPPPTPSVASARGALRTLPGVPVLPNPYETNQKSTVTSDLFLKPIENQAFQKFQELKLGKEFFFIDDLNLSNTIAFCEVLTTYFDDVLINAEDPKIANNRRSFIQEVNQYFQSAGNWLKLSR